MLEQRSRDWNYLQSQFEVSQIEPTTNCNYSCITCIRHSWGDDLSHMPWPVFEKLLKDMAELPNAVFRWTVRNSHYPSCIDCQQADGCVMAQTNEGDCWGNRPSCGDCLWARNIVVCL